MAHVLDLQALSAPSNGDGMLVSLVSNHCGSSMSLICVEPKE